MSLSLWFNFWPSFLFVIFPEWAESNSACSKVFCCYFLFYSSLFWFPEVPFLCTVKGYSRLSPFSCWIFDTWEGRICPLFLCFFFWHFPLSCLNPVLTMLYASGISSPWQPLGIPTQFFYASSSSIFWSRPLFFFSSFIGFGAPFFFFFFSFLVFGL